MLFSVRFSPNSTEEIAKFNQENTIFNEGRPFVEYGDFFVEYVSNH